jgi:hypothetical protein
MKIVVDSFGCRSVSVKHGWTGSATVEISSSPPEKKLKEPGLRAWLFQFNRSLKPAL